MELSGGWGCVVYRVVIGECDINGPGGMLTLGQLPWRSLWGRGIYGEELHVLLLSQLDEVTIPVLVVQHNVMTTNLFPVSEDE